MEFYGLIGAFLAFGLILMVICAIGLGFRMIFNSSVRTIYLSDGQIRYQFQLGKFLIGVVLIVIAVIMFKVVFKV